MPKWIIAFSVPPPSWIDWDEAPPKIKNVSFNANLFKDVLVANKECESATLEVSEGGLARINFKVDDYDVTYYLVAVQDVD